MSTPSVTIQNLEAAFAGESMAHIKYRYFARLAREAGDEDTARVFEATADQEVQHAFGHLDLLYPKARMSPARALQIAIEGETYEYTEMYPDVSPPGDPGRQRPGGGSNSTARSPSRGNTPRSSGRRWTKAAKTLRGAGQGRGAAREPLPRHAGTRQRFAGRRKGLVPGRREGNVPRRREAHVARRPERRLSTSDGVRLNPNRLEPLQE